MKTKGYCSRCAKETEGVLYIWTTPKNTKTEYFRCKNKVNNKVCNKVNIK